MNPGSPSSSRYGWLSDEQLAAAMQRNPDMLKPIQRPAAPAVVMPAVPVPTTRLGRIKSAAVALLQLRKPKL